MSRGRAGTRVAWALLAALAVGGCMHGASDSARDATGASTLAALGVHQAVLQVNAGPALFATASRSGQPVGYVRDAEVRVADDARGDVVPVVVEGPLEVHAFAPADRLYLRVQRRGQLRGSAAYVAPGNLVRVVGPGEKHERVRVEAVPVVEGAPLSPSVGTFPLAGLGLEPPSARAEAPEAGSARILPANTALPLHERPSGAVLMVMPPRAHDLPCAVLFEEHGWAAVRVGDGPYVVGFTSLALAPGKSPASATVTRPAQATVPRSLADEAGELVRVLAGTDVSFDGRVLGHLHRDGYARVLHSYASGEVDAFVAIDDRVAIRGLVHKEQLRRLHPAEHAPVAKGNPNAKPSFGPMR